jgi:hypothetical protein
MLTSLINGVPPAGLGGELYTVVYEERNDKDGQYYHLATLWKATKKERLIYEENT